MSYRSAHGLLYYRVMGKKWLTILGLTLFFGTSARADSLDEVRRAALEIQVLGRDRAQLLSAAAQLEKESSELSASVEKKKASWAGLRRDYELSQLLAAAQAKAQELERVAVKARWRQAPLLAARRQLVEACDRALSRAGLAASTRIELVQLRTAQVTLLSQEQSGPPKIGEVHSDALDGPRELSEKADLLRDSEDKLHKESARLSLRIDDIDRRLRLRDQAFRIDEDLFGEANSTRVGVGSAQNGLRTGNGGRNGLAASPQAPTQKTGGASGNSPAPVAADNAPPAPGVAGAQPGTNTPQTPVDPGGANGGFGNKTSETTSAGNDHSSGSTAPSYSLRNLVDSATLAEMDRLGSIGDASDELRALKRAQSELNRLAEGLGRRANQLSHRADELKGKK